MGKKNPAKEDRKENLKKSRREPLKFFSLGINDIDPKTLKQHIFYLILVSLLTKFIILIITPSVLHSFVDYYDISYYFERGIMLTQGQIPYVNYPFEYPLFIFIPITLALIPAFLFQNVMAFVYSFQLMMVLCDIVITICVYLISLKLMDSKTALYAGLLYATAFSAAYFVLTKYDAFPTCLFMVALLLTVYGKKVAGYLAITAGFFAKVYPIISLPFIIFYNSKESSIKTELISAGKIFIPLAVLFIVPFMFFRTDIIRTYIPTRTSLDYYSNTVTFTIYTWLHDVFHFAVSLDMILTVMFFILVGGLLTLLYIAWRYPKKDTLLLLQLLLCSIILVIFCVKVRSPQYIVWFTPLLCILAVDDIRKIILVYLVQALAFIEFPLMFGTYYISTQYSPEPQSVEWFTILIVFTLEYLALFVCLYFVIRPREILKKIRRTEPSNT